MVTLRALYLHLCLLQLLLGCSRMQVNAPEALLLWGVTRLVCSWFVCVRSIYVCSSVEMLVIKTWGLVSFLCILGCQWWLIFNHITEDKLAC